MTIFCKNSLMALLALIMSQANAQYAFESKKAEKLYNQLEGLYEKADYAAILAKEEAIRSNFFAKKDTLTATMYSFLAESYLYENDDYNTAIDFYQKQRDLHRSLGMPPDIDQIYNIASLQDEIGEYEKSETLYLELLGLLEESDPDYVLTVQALLDHYTYTFEADKGLSLIKKTRKLVDKDTYESAMRLKAEGDFWEIKGSFTRAEQRYKTAMQILENTGNFPSRESVNILNALGQLYLNKSQLPDAEVAFKEAINVLNRMGGDNEIELEVTNFNLAQVYFEYGFFNDALEAYKDILESDKTLYGEESQPVALTQSVLGGIYFESGDYANSESNLLAAKALFEDLGDVESFDYARVMSDLMRLYTATNDIAQAREYGKQTLTLFKDIYGDDHPRYATALSNYAEVNLQTNDLDAAEEKLREAQRIRDKTLGKNHPLWALSQRKLAILNWRRDNIAEALDFYDGTFDNYFNQINTFFPILSEQEKSKFYYNKLRPTFEQFNSFVVEKNRDNGELIGKMYNYQLATKGIILAATTKVRENILNSGDEELIGKYEEWIGQKEELARLFSATNMPIDERNAAIDSLTAIATQLEKDLSESSSSFKTAFASQQTTWQDVQEKLKPGEAAVEIIRFRDFDPARAGSYTDQVYYAALILTNETKDAPDLVLMDNGKMMETRFLANYRNAIKYQVNENYSYKLFWKPIAEQLAGVEKVFFSPDGVYNQISIYTLQNPETKDFTIDEVEIQLVNNTKDLVAYNFDKASEFGTTSYLFGFPNYNMGALEESSGAITTTDITEFSQAAAENRGSRGTRGGSDFGAPATGSLSRGAIPRGIRGNLLRYVDENSLLALLPGTRTEVNLIDSLWQEKDREPLVYMSDEAIEERIKEVENPHTLHIATHGFFLQNEQGGEGENDAYVENPLLRSGLILAGANSYISHGRISNTDRPEDDGILTAYEAMNLNLDDTELVVLSACETGLGEVQNGEGVFGLQRSFQIAGADAIIMSMWTVDDNATQELMTNFYEEWLTSGNKHQAFITAQKRLKEKYDAPYYWGAFVMVGN